MGAIEDIEKTYDEMEKAGLLDQRTIDRIHRPVSEMYVGFEPYNPDEKEEWDNFIKKMWATSPTIIPDGAICSLIPGLDDFSGAVKEAGCSTDDIVDAFRYAFDALGLRRHVRGWHYRQMVHRRKQYHKSSRSM